MVDSCYYKIMIYFSTTETILSMCSANSKGCSSTHTDLLDFPVPKENIRISDQGCQVT